MVKVLLFAGGAATRMFPFSAYTEKCLLPLPDGKPIIRHLAERLTSVNSPFVQNDLLLLCQDKHVPAFKHEFRDMGVEYYSTIHQLGTLRHMMLVMRAFTDVTTFVVHYADMVTDIAYDRLMATHDAQKKKATAVLTAVKSPYGSVSTKAVDGNLMIDGFREKPVLSELVWTGVAVFDRTVLPYIEKIVGEKDRPDIGAHLMPALTDVGCLGAYIHKGVWDDVGSSSQYLKLIENGSASK